MGLPDDLRDAFVLPEGCLYLDTASHAPRLRAVDTAARAAWDAGITPWRPAFDEWEASIERVRCMGSRLLHADRRADADGIALVPSVAYAMAIAAAACPLRAGDVVLMLEGEFPSTLLAWQQRCLQAGARLETVARVDATRGVLQRLSTGRVDVLVLSQAHWRDGRLLDLDRIAAATQAGGVPLVLDLSQSLGVLPCDVERWRPAFVASVGYKWLLGGKGLCLLWVAPDRRDTVAALESHWQARAPVQPWRFEADEPAPFRPGMRRLDAGEIADPLRLAVAEAGLSQVMAWTPAAIAARLGELTTRLVTRLEDAGRGDWCLRPASPHLLGLRPPSDRTSTVRDALARARVVCVERDGVFRIAPHLHIDEAGIDRAADVFVQAR